MTYLEAVLLGALQGVTEFLPISSSGHLVLGQAWLGISLPGKTFEVVLHLGSLISILLVFWPDIRNLVLSLHQTATRRYAGILLWATLPAALIGIWLEEWFDQAFDSPHLVAASLVVTGLILFATKFLTPGQREVDWKRGFYIGLAQMCAIVPGISRSGSTISAALALGVESQEAARFSFLLALPAIAGAGLLTLREVMVTPELGLPLGPALAGFLTSVLVGYAALTWLLRIVSRGKLYQFSAYCFILGMLAWIV
ncbi:MAG: undecaprenyl-diphosphate phosphatase [Candidatus Neomarinimicrobiota bacterium]|nr:MAG: undecaprenyl-diphosphate phosphatase [Candidatus Neomarinimicrobiota bacterium]